MDIFWIVSNKEINCKKKVEKQIAEPDWVTFIIFPHHKISYVTTMGSKSLRSKVVSK